MYLTKDGSINSYGLDMRVVCILLSMCLQNLDIVSFGSIALKPFHIVVLIVFFLILRNIALVSDTIKVSFAIATLSLISLVLALAYGFNVLVVNYIFALFMIVVMSNYLSDLDYCRFINSVVFVAVVVILYVLLNIGVNYSSVRYAMLAEATTGIRPDIPMMLFSGGLNIEATWVSFLSALCLRHRLFPFLIFASIIVSSLYMSRTGFILNVVAILGWMYIRLGSKFLLSLVLVLLLSLFLSFTLFRELLVSLDVPVLNRFLQIGNEPGSQGRLEILNYVYDGLKSSYYMGVGAGNAMNFLAGFGMDSHNDNVHNYYIQVLLEFGILGLVVYLCFCFLYLTDGSVRSEFKTLLIMYMVASLVQFRGAEPLFWFSLMVGLLNGVRNFDHGVRKRDG